MKHKKEPQKATLCSITVHDTTGSHVEIARKDLKLVTTEEYGLCLYYESDDGDLYLPINRLATVDRDSFYLAMWRRNNEPTVIWVGNPDYAHPVAVVGSNTWYRLDEFNLIRKLDFDELRLKP